MTDKLSVYFSHSWHHTHLPVNLMLWNQLAEHCHLLIDRPEPTAANTRPYYICRIESLLRRADAFVAVLPQLPQEKQTARRAGAVGDWRYHHCSPYILFELRLAERADLPCFVLYDTATNFRPPANPRPHLRYVGRRFEELQALLAGDGIDRLLTEEFDNWLAATIKHRIRRTAVETDNVACLLSDDSVGQKLHSTISDAVDEFGFDQPLRLESAFRTDAELYQALRSVGLLIADVSRPEIWPLYHAAHSLMVPTIRIFSSNASPSPDDDSFLPTLLRGHPAGYQMDMFPGEDPEVLSTWAGDRARSLRRSALPVIGRDQGQSLLYERTYPRPHFVFLSHDEKLHDRALVDAIVAECAAKGIDLWEYATENRAGEEWRKNMADALRKTTHMVALLSPNYETSTGCEEEWNFALSHKIPILPFLTRGRTSPSTDLKREDRTHEPLYATRSTLENARCVVERLRRELLNPVASESKPGSP